ncbi:cytochrome o ubiquinol oxidase subunit III [Oceanicella sp. SM1341]|uniref:cytochrome o ubiquinol oxidase subunit III n=1 Tax=Oceanicella sp. SM1341 TaxID=1548889 RepID=UPI000E4732D1|nr:cytochrome o ubiquinol oxidase subunit III [Oceanicella sp. SM1341]
MSSSTLANHGAHGAAVHHEDDHHHDVDGTTQLGFWIYLMSDCIIFATLFATYAVLAGATDGGPTGRELFELGFVFIETMFLLASSGTCGLAMLASDRGDADKVSFWLKITFVLGACFIAMEVYEFQHLIHEGASPQRSAFLSAFFTLVGTHGLHVTAGLVWMGVLMFQIKRFGVGGFMTRRLATFSMFWHFLDVVWICVFTLVYLKGAM